MPGAPPLMAAIRSSIPCRRPEILAAGSGSRESLAVSGPATFLHRVSTLRQRGMAEDLDHLFSLEDPVSSPVGERFHDAGYQGSFDLFAGGISGGSLPPVAAARGKNICRSVSLS